MNADSSFIHSDTMFVVPVIYFYISTKLLLNSKLKSLKVLKKVCTGGPLSVGFYVPEIVDQFISALGQLPCRRELSAGRSGERAASELRFVEMIINLGLPS